MQIAKIWVVDVFHKHAVVVSYMHAEHGLVEHNLAHRRHGDVVPASVFGYNAVPCEFHPGFGAGASGRAGLPVAPGVVIAAAVVVVSAVVFQRQHEPPGKGEVRPVQYLPV